MAEPNKSTAPFTFNNPTTSSSSSNMFGKPASDASKPAGGLFGSVANPTTTSGSSLFGSNNTSTSNAGGLFGAGTKPSTTSGSSLFGGASTAGGSTLFGATSGPSQNPAFGGASNIFGGNKQAGSPFGQPASQGGQTSSSAAPSNSFSGFSTPNKPADSSTSGQGQTPSLFGGTGGGGTSGGLFGNLGSNASSAAPGTTSTPTSKPPINFFANSTTPAGPPPSTGMGTAAPSLFSKPAADSTSLFGKKVESSGSQPFSLGSSSGSSGLNFGGSSKPQDSAPTTSSMQSSGLFGSTVKTGNSGSDLFGKKPAQAEGGLFQNLNKPADASTAKPVTTQQPQTEAPKAHGLFNLGGQPSTSTSSSTTSAAPSFLFPKATQAQSSAASDPAISSSAAPGGFNVFNPPKSSSTPTPSTSAPLFPRLGKSQDTTPAATSSTEPTSTAATSSTAPTVTSTLFSNMGKSPAATTQAPNQPVPQTTGSESQKLGASTAGPIPPAQSRLKTKSMDDIITRWASDLSKYQKEFQQQAERVADWDRKLVENSEKIQKLYGSTLEAERATTEVERQLTAVESDQAELAHWLDYYEKEVDTMISNTFGQDGTLSGPDQEREKTYQMASDLSERLDEMGKDLSSMIEEINDASSTLSRTNKTDDPLSQVVRVLNGHLTQLQQIDQGTAALQLKVQEARRASYSLGPSHGLSAPSSEAADGFYRSYMGRR